MRNIFIFFVAIVTGSLFSSSGYAQVYDFRELSNEEIAQLPRDRTAIVIPGGILEQHGPYLPAYTDGYSNEHIAREVSQAIVEKPGWVALIFPPIPLGVGGVHLRPNPLWPGTMHVHFETLRAVYLDLAAELGEAGFRWVFLFQDHGSVQHNLALEQASDFFTDTYHGRMVYLGGLALPPSPSTQPLLSPEVEKENGLDIHAGLDETSRMLFLRPDLVKPKRTIATPLAGDSWDELVRIGTQQNWPGYFGSPRLASVALGAEILRREIDQYSAIVLRILDGFDPQSLRQQVDKQEDDHGRRKYNAMTVEHERRIKSIQQKWLASKGLLQ